MFTLLAKNNITHIAGASLVCVVDPAMLGKLKKNCTLKTQRVKILPFLSLQRVDFTECRLFLQKNTKLTPPPEATILFWIYFWNLCGAQYNLITSFSANLIYTICRTACLLALRHSTYYSDSSILNQGQTQTKKLALYEN